MHPAPTELVDQWDTPRLPSWLALGGRDAPHAYRATSCMRNVTRPLPTELAYAMATQCTPWLAMLACVGECSALLQHTGLDYVGFTLGDCTHYGLVVKAIPNLYHAWSQT